MMRDMFAVVLRSERNTYSSRSARGLRNRDNFQPARYGIAFSDISRSEMNTSTNPTLSHSPVLTAVLAACVFFAMISQSAMAQSPLIHHGEVVPRDVREMYDRGLQYLANKQTENGDWNDGQGGPGTTGMAIMTFMASGEDPNFGRYRNNVRRALRSIISSQDSSTGCIGGGSYQHGFAMLALSESYGAVDDRDLWPAGQKSKDGAKGRSIGAALELAVRSAVTSQKKNPQHGWRYSPDATDADTSVSGAMIVGLFAARNAGIEVPDSAIDGAISYYKSMTSESGEVAYSGIGGFGESTARVSIGTLVYALARRVDLPQYKASLANLIKQPEQESPYQEYGRYYQSQALFQGNIGAWEKWNKQLIRKLKANQRDDGSFSGQFGDSISTSMSLLALALNYRLLPIYER